MRTLSRVRAHHRAFGFQRGAARVSSSGRSSRPIARRPLPARSARPTVVTVKVQRPTPPRTAHRARSRARRRRKAKVCALMSRARAQSACSRILPNSAGPPRTLVADLENRWGSSRLMLGERRGGRKMVETRVLGPTLCVRTVPAFGVFPQVDVMAEADGNRTRQERDALLNGFEDLNSPANAGNNTKAAGGRLRRLTVDGNRGVHSNADNGHSVPATVPTPGRPSHSRLRGPSQTSAQLRAGTQARNHSRSVQPSAGHIVS